ncbi:hypothetical protein FA13DRAFT_1730118 [Coprinellus micaceus]|uniref:Uncharacterized protein n=1 Tax=Coprinellus micaceus TaxID=71717 RepID=A0A4Y7TIT4_COPMI|nr:hypothetical protein FA13DRAFT_1730118 [Coprinellus micaceus]
MSAPIERVPDDVLRAIFTRCLPPHRWSTTVSPEQAPCIFLRVCKRWHKVAKDHALLWNWLNLTLYCESRKPSETKYRALERLLKCAKCAPASLRIAKIGAWSDAVEGVEGEIAPEPSFISRLVLLNPSCLSRLILQSFLNFPWEIAGPITAFSECPFLHRVFLKHWSQGFQTNFGLRNLCLPLEHLTHYYEEETTLPASHFLLGYLPRCKKLENLYLELFEHEDMGEAAFSSWSWNECRYFQYPAFFDKVEFPNLSHLRLEGFQIYLQGDGPWNPAQIARFLSKLNGLENLVYLALCLNEVDHDTLRLFFGATPRITTLEIGLYRDLEVVFEALTPIDPVHPLLPKLDTLVLEVGHTGILVEGEDDETVKPGALKAFLEYRLGSEGSRRIDQGRLHKIAAFTTTLRPEEVGDDKPYVQVIQEYVLQGLVFERFVVPERGDPTWLYRDPRLEDWPEALWFMS